MNSTTPNAQIGRYLNESTPRLTPRPKAPDGAPNVIVILLDDMGFAQLGCYGSDIETPNIDRLAARGLRYNQFHVTSLCSPTRAALLTGRNHHSVGMGFLSDMPTGYPGYTGRIPRTAATVARILKDQGFSTMAVGKWHIAPRWDQTAVGPFDWWPLGLGFERHYGFLGGDTNQYAPNLVCDNRFIEQPKRPDEGYHLTEDLADQAIRMMRDVKQTAPDRPFFLYFATGATHAPHSAPPEWIDRYRGRYDDGWEAFRNRIFAKQKASGLIPADTTLPERPSWIQAWDSLSNDERRLFARMQEVFAGFLSHTDAQIGRLLEFLESIDELDNTLILFMSDNGASAEGGPIGAHNEHRFTSGLHESLDDNLDRIDELGGHRTYNHYAWGWAWAGNTPFRLWKRYTWLGGVRVPLIVHWPNGIAPSERGAVRPQFAHVIDVMPTILEAVGVDVPAVVDGATQQPVEGASLLATFGATGATVPSPRATQYFEMVGSRAIYHHGWKATTDHVSKGVVDEVEQLVGSLEFETDRWQLFDLGTDFAEAHDLSDAQPDRLRELTERWWIEAGRHQVLPLEDALVSRIVAMEPSPFPMRDRYVYRPGGGPIGDAAAPMLIGGYTLTAEVERASDHSTLEGVLCAQGDWISGWGFYVADGRLVWAICTFGFGHTVSAPCEIPVGRSQLQAVIKPVPGGGLSVELSVDGRAIGDGSVAANIPFTWQHGGAGLTIGYDKGFPVTDDYAPPFQWTGIMHELVIEPAPFVMPSPAASVASELHHE